MGEDDCSGDTACTDARDDSTGTTDTGTGKKSVRIELSNVGLGLFCEDMDEASGTVCTGTRAVSRDAKGERSCIGTATATAAVVDDIVKETVEGPCPSTSDAGVGTGVEITGVDATED